MIELLLDWGAWLEVNLYREAMIHYLGGMDHVVRTILVRTASGTLGRQKVFMLTEGYTFLISALRHGQDVMLEHQRRFLAHTDLRAVAWINLNGSLIEFRTISNDDVAG